MHPPQTWHKNILRSCAYTLTKHHTAWSSASTLVRFRIARSYTYPDLEAQGEDKRLPTDPASRGEVMRLYPDPGSHGEVICLYPDLTLHGEDMCLYLTGHHIARSCACTLT